MSNLKKLLQQLSTQENLLTKTQFIAPCVANSCVKTSVAKIIYTFKTQPKNFEGWGIFQPINHKLAQLIDQPSFPQICHYLELLKPLRLRLAYHLQGQSWLGYPVNESDMQQRFKTVKPVVIHLVTEGSIFETIIARFDGLNFWFEDLDRKAEIEPMLKLSEQLKLETLPDHLQFSGLTPEMLKTYDLAWQQTATGKQQREIRAKIKGEKKISKAQKRRENKNILQRPDERLDNALKQGGGSLENFSDRGDFWLVEWRTSEGDLHSSAISKDDLTVISSGICLSGKDQDFDLQSLVGVIEKQDYYY